MYFVALISWIEINSEIMLSIILRVRYPTILGCSKYPYITVYVTKEPFCRCQERLAHSYLFLY